MIQIAFVVLLGILSLGWGCLFWGSGQVKIISWWSVMFFGPVGGLIVLFATFLLIKKVLQRRKPEKSLVGLLLLALVAGWPLGWFVGIGQIAYPADINRVKPAVSIRLPINGPAQIGWGGDSLKTNYHAAVPVERWAYDLIGLPAAVGSPNLTDYGIYGVQVVAPASGAVVDVRNDSPDLIPGTELNSSDTREMLGNFVFIHLDETQTYLVIAHLQPGSILVKPGQHVDEGAPIARVGNSGSSSEPHIHIHHQRQDPAQTNPFLAEGLPLYFHAIDGPAMPTGGIGMENNREVPIGQIVSPLKP